MQQDYWTNQQIELVVAGPGCSQRFVLAQPYALIGSDASCDVVLDDERLPGRCYVALVSPTGLLLGASLVRRSPARFQQLDGERGIRAGRFRIQFGIAAAPLRLQESSDLDPSKTRRSVVGRLRWKVEGRRKFADLCTGKPLLLGRSKPSRLCVNDPAVSTVHGLLYLHDQQIWLVDLASRNGIRVNNRRVRCSTLNAGDSCVIGETWMTFDSLPDALDNSGSAARPLTLPEEDREELRRRYDVLQSERETLAQEVERLRQMLDTQMQYRQALEHEQQEWRRRQFEFEHQQTLWLQQQTEQREQLDGRERTFETIRLEHVAEVKRWEHEREQEQSDWAQACQAEADRQAQQWEELVQRHRQMLAALESDQAELERAKSDLQEQKSVLAEVRLQLQEQERAWQTQCQSLARDREQFELQRQEHGTELERVKELLLVRRIRLQRDLHRRDAELTERETLLERREQALCERTAALERQTPARRPQRKIVLPPGVAESTARKRSESTSHVRTSERESIELSQSAIGIGRFHGFAQSSD